MSTGMPVQGSSTVLSVPPPGKCVGGGCLAVEGYLVSHRHQREFGNKGFLGSALELSFQNLDNESSDGERCAHPLQGPLLGNVRTPGQGHCAGL